MKRACAVRQDGICPSHHLTVVEYRQAALVDFQDSAMCFSWIAKFCFMKYYLWFDRLLFLYSVSLHLYSLSSDWVPVMDFGFFYLNSLNMFSLANNTFVWGKFDGSHLKAERKLAHDLHSLLQPLSSPMCPLLHTDIHTFTSKGRFKCPRA